jgi:SAM-dependent methyltransferase
MTHAYDNTFFDWVDFTATRSARAVLPLINDLVRPRSVVDVGCGRGAWLGVWASLGLADIKGLDGDYVDRTKLAMAPTAFEAVDLTSLWPVPRRFDLAQSLEVAEHLAPEVGPQFVAQLCALSDVVMFSAAQPGQGGEMHYNERKPSYWAELFAGQGYAAFDCLRPVIRADKSIDPWYRFNTVVYANATGQARLAASVAATRVSELTDLDHAGDMVWKLRTTVLRPLPMNVVSALSRMRYSLATAGSQARAAMKS